MQNEAKSRGMLSVCKDHVELGIDWFVDEMEMAPDLILMEEARARFPGSHVPELCIRCGRPAEFVVCISGE